MAALTPHPHVVLYGGTFDPVHHGHLIPALRARELLGADRLVLLPANRSPHKLMQDPGASGDDRRAMLRLAVDGVAGFSVDPRELTRAGASYTVDTVAEIRTEFPQSRLTLLLGVDQLAKLHLWHRIADILSNVEIALLPRPAVVADLSAARAHLGPAIGDRLERALLDTPLINLSATEIRARARAGLPLTYLVPSAVEAYIRERRLYR